MDKFNNFDLCEISDALLKTMTNEEKHGFNSIIGAVNEQFPKADIYTAKLGGNRLDLSIGIKPMPQSGQRDKAAVNFFRIRSNDKGFFIAYNRERGQVNRINEKINGKVRAYYLGDGQQVQAFIEQLEKLAQNDEAKNLLNGQGYFPNDYAKHKNDGLDPFFSEHFKPSHIEKILKFSEIKQQDLKKVYLDLRKIFPQCDFYVRKSGFVLCCGIVPDRGKNAPVVTIRSAKNGSMILKLTNKTRDNIKTKINTPNIATEFTSPFIVGTETYQTCLEYLDENCNELFKGRGLNPIETQDEENSPEDYEADDDEYNNKDQKTPLNQILYGPPGTGKTYHTIEAAVKAVNPDSNNFDNREELKKEYDELVANGQIQFVTFHQSYGYEEFVEGLTAKSENGQVVYERKDGIFKRICAAARAHYSPTEISATNEFDSKWNEFISELSETESGIKIPTLSKKTYFTITDITDTTIRFDKAQGDSIHTLSIQTLKNVASGEKTIKGGLQPYYNALINFINSIKVTVPSNDAKERKNFVLVIDEINRGNISKIFGELITLIEPSKRFGEDECVEITLPYSDADDPKFSVPNNLYIIGTMNTADRSLALMDTALRRRFDFIEMMPDYSKLEDTKINPNGSEINLGELLKTLNKRIEALYDRDHTLGHAFFMPLKDILEDKDQSNEQALTELSAVFKNKIIPLLQEYFFEDWNKIRLVLGDNQKANSDLQFTREKENNFKALFGEDLNTNNTFNQPDKAYELKPFSDKIWTVPHAYSAIYDPKAKSNSAKNSQEEAAPAEPELTEGE